MSRRGYMTPEEFAALNRYTSPWEDRVGFRDRYALADPAKAISCPPFEGEWAAYFNANLACGQLKSDDWPPRSSCGARDWAVIPSGVWVPRGGHTIRCKSCGRVDEVLVIAEAP